MIIDSSFAALLLETGNSFIEDGNYEKALNNVEKAHQILKILTDTQQKEDENNDFSNYLISMEKLASIYSSLGNQKKSFEYIQMHYDFTSTHLAPVSSSSIISQFLLANHYFSASQLEKAEEHFSKFEDLCQKYLIKNPLDLGSAINLGKAYCYLGNIYFERGNINKASEKYSEYNFYLSELIKTNKQNLEIKYDLAVSYYKLSEICQKKNQIQKAISHCTHYLIRTKELYEKNKNSILYAEAVASGYYFLGRIYLENNAIKSAKEYFEKYHSLKTNLKHTYPNNLNYTKDIIVVTKELSTIYLHEGDTERAAKNQLFCYTEIKKIIEKEPHSLEHKQTLSIVLETLIHTFGQMQKYQQVLEYANESLELCIKLCQENNDLYNQEGLVYAYTNLGEVFAHLNKVKEAIEHYKKGISLLEIIIDQSPNTIHYQDQITSFRSRLKLLENHNQN